MNRSKQPSIVALMKRSGIKELSLALEQSLIQLRFIKAILLSLILSLPAHAVDDIKQSAEQLKSIQGQINQTRESLQKDKKQQAAMKQHLKKTQSELSKITQTLQETNQALSETSDELGLLNQEFDTLAESLATHQTALGEQFRSTYRLGTVSPLQQWLMLQDKTQIGRDMVYMRYLNQARIATLGDVKTELATAAELQEAMQEKQMELQEQLNQQQEQQQQLNVKQEEHNQLVASLGDTIETKDQALEQLVQDENKLSQLLKQLQAKADSAHSGIAGKPFAQLRGKLPRPVDGKVTSSFGSKQTVSGLPSNGLFIASTVGQPVKAVQAGSVVYADWLRGYGRLVIVDHGNGYMTLYAHNQTLNKKPGDKITMQETIATVGDGSGQPGLYFEIRHKGQPINPAPWLSSR